MKIDEAERAIRSLCRQWIADVYGGELPAGTHPSWSDFKVWLELKGYSHYLEFRSRRGANADAELWFDDEFGQSWRR